MKLEKQILKLALIEMKRARSMYPTNDKRFGSVGEEAGELLKAVMENNEGKAQPTEVLHEGIQAISAILRLIVEGDSNYHYDNHAVNKILKRLTKQKKR